MDGRTGNFSTNSGRVRIMSDHEYVSYVEHRFNSTHSNANKQMAFTKHQLYIMDQKVIRAVRSLGCILR